MRGKAGIGKVALYGREYLVAVRAQEKCLVMYTLHHAAEVRGMDQIDELRTLPDNLKPDEVKLARQVIGTFEEELDFTNFKDEYREGLRRIIEARIAGEEVVAAVSGTKKKPAKADLAAARKKASAPAPVAKAAERKRKTG
jgi:DNA end-binding protein Ku